MNDIGIIGIHHIGYYVKNIENSRKMFSHMGFIMQEIYMDEKRGIRLAFGTLAENRVELVEAAGDNSVVLQMRKGGTRPYHVCYEVEDIIKSVSILREKYKCIIINEVAESTIDLRRIVHLYNKDMGVFELIEKGN